MKQAVILFSAFIIAAIPNVSQAAAPKPDDIDPALECIYQQNEGGVDTLISPGKPGSGGGEAHFTFDKKSGKLEVTSEVGKARSSSVANVAALCRATKRYKRVVTYFKIETNQELVPDDDAETIDPKKFVMSGYLKFCCLGASRKYSSTAGGIPK